MGHWCCAPGEPVASGPMAEQLDGAITARLGILVWRRSAGCNKMHSDLAPGSPVGRWPIYNVNARLEWIVLQNAINSQGNPSFASATFFPDHFQHPARPGT